MTAGPNSKEDVLGETRSQRKCRDKPRKMGRSLLGSRQKLSKTLQGPALRRTREYVFGACPNLGYSFSGGPNASLSDDTTFHLSARHTGIGRIPPPIGIPPYRRKDGNLRCGPAENEASPARFSQQSLIARTLHNPYGLIQRTAREEADLCAPQPR